MKKIFTLLITAFMAVVFAACGSEGSNASSKTNSSEAKVATEQASPAGEAQVASKGKTLVAYFSCTGNTKTLAETTAKVLGADLYEIRPETPYTANDLNYNDKTTRATIEQKDDSARPALADHNAGIEGYDMIVLAYPIWWGQAPRIMDTFVESYDFAGKTIVPICTSGGSDIGSSADYLQKLMKGTANWKQGKRFNRQASESEIKEWLYSIAR